ncbi:MAG: hypothetical protein ACRDRV_13680 [Pseudonocardiaceae bacterium]
MRTVPNSDDLETRVASLEGQVARLQGQAALAVSDAGAARLLAAGADQDVSTVRGELRAHTQVLNALRETQLEQGLHISSLEQKVAGLDHNLTGLDHKVTGLDHNLTGLDHKVTEGFATLSTQLAQITALLREAPGSGRS